MLYICCLWKCSTWRISRSSEESQRLFYAWVSNDQARLHWDHPFFCPLYTLYFPKHMFNRLTIMNSNLFRILHLSWRIARRLFVRKHLANGCKWFIALWIARGTWRSPWNKRAGNLTAQPSRLRCGAWRVLETSFRDVVALGDEKALTVPTNNVEKGYENIWSTCFCLSLHTSFEPRIWEYNKRIAQSYRVLMEIVCIVQNCRRRFLCTFWKLSRLQRAQKHRKTACQQAVLPLFFLAAKFLHGSVMILRLICSMMTVEHQHRCLLYDVFVSESGKQRPRRCLHAVGLHSWLALARGDWLPWRGRTLGLLARFWQLWDWCRSCS